MNKQELIKRYENTFCTIISINGVLEDLRQLDEPQKVTVPQFVADYIKYAIENDWDFQDLFKYIEDEEDEELLRWVYHERNQETLAAAWINGYTVEEEKQYRVKLKTLNDYLNETETGLHFYNDYKNNKTFTRKELEKAGFGWMFDCPGIEIEEVKG